MGWDLRFGDLEESWDIACNERSSMEKFEILAVTTLILVIDFDHPLLTS